MFSGFTVPPNTKENQVGSSGQEDSPSASENTKVLLVPCRTSKCALTANSCGVDIFETPGCH